MCVPRPPLGDAAHATRGNSCCLRRAGANRRRRSVGRARIDALGDERRRRQATDGWRAPFDDRRLSGALVLVGVPPADVWCAAAERRPPRQCEHCRVDVLRRAARHLRLYSFDECRCVGGRGGGGGIDDDDDDDIFGADAARHASAGDDDDDNAAAAGAAATAGANAGDSSDDESALVGVSDLVARAPSAQSVFRFVIVFEAPNAAPGDVTYRLVAALAGAADARRRERARSR